METLKRYFLFWILLSFLLHLLFLSVEVGLPSIRVKNPFERTVSLAFVSPPKRKEVMPPLENNKKEREKRKRKVFRKVRRKVKTKVEKVRKVRSKTGKTVKTKPLKKLNVSEKAEKIEEKNEVQLKKEEAASSEERTERTNDINRKMERIEKEETVKQTVPPFSIEPYVRAVISEINKHKTYPPLAKRLGIEGKVVLEVTINRDGAVRDIKVIKPAHGILNKAAVKLIRDCRFPPLPDGFEGNSLKVKVPISYVLK